MVLSKQILEEQFNNELKSIFRYWMSYTVDYVNGGFYGAINNQNIVNKGVPKGAVLNARILWSFASVYNFTKDGKYLEIAHISFHYLRTYFTDNEFGGVYWSLDNTGEPLDVKKQTYALAFAVYGLAEYYKACEDSSALSLAIALFHDIEKNAYDAEEGGYIEAFTRDWQEITDMRLSDKDANEKKTMNTHLHVLEAYANLFLVWPDDKLKLQIKHLLDVFENHILNKKNFHLRLFFNENWKSSANIISYGHDIEASWLLLEAAENIKDEIQVKKFKRYAVSMAEATFEGIDDDGGLNYELDLDRKHLIKEKHWWVQAEAMVGFLNAYQINQSDRFYEQFVSIWQFIRQHIIDHENGEWFWGVNEDGSIMQGQDKAGFWKCPYHNSRACIEILKRLT